MPRMAVSTRKAPQPAGAYSQAVEAGGFVFVSGQGPIDPHTGSVTGTTIEEQVRATFKNIEAILAAEALTLNDIVKVTAYLSDMHQFPEYDKAYLTVFRPPLPARTTVGASLAGIMVEIDVIAKKPTASDYLY